MQSQDSGGAVGLVPAAGQTALLAPRGAQGAGAYPVTHTGDGDAYLECPSESPLTSTVPPVSSPEPLVVEQGQGTGGERRLQETHSPICFPQRSLCRKNRPCDKAEAAI